MHKLVWACGGPTEGLRSYPPDIIAQTGHSSISGRLFAVVEVGEGARSAGVEEVDGTCSDSLASFSLLASLIHTYI